MKKISCFLILIGLFSCTSNTIFEKPKNLIPKDTMSLLLEDLMVASAAKFHNNKLKESNVNYAPLVYKKYKIDSVRFKISNDYYVTVIDTYKEILEDAKKSLETKERKYSKIQMRLDSIKDEIFQDSIKRMLVLDSIKADSIEKLRIKKAAIPKI